MKEDDLVFVLERRWRLFPPTLSVFSPRRLNMFSEAATAPRKMSYLSARPLNGTEEHLNVGKEGRRKSF